MCCSIIIKNRTQSLKSVHSLLVLVTEEQSLLNLCRPKDTSSLEDVLRTPVGHLMEAGDRPGVVSLTPAVLLTFSEPLQPQNNEEEKKVRRKVGGAVLPPSGSRQT